MFKAIYYYYLNQKINFKDSTWKRVTSSRTVPTIKVKGLEQGKDYVFRIRAENRFGTSSAITTKTITPQNPHQVPSPPGKPQVVSVADEGITVKWRKSSEDGGTSITAYIIEYKDKNSIMWQVRKLKISFFNHISFKLWLFTKLE